MKRTLTASIIALLSLSIMPVIAEPTAYTITDLGTLGGNRSYAYGINDSGQVVGKSTIAGDSAYHAFLYNGSSMHDLGTFGKEQSNAYNINNAGQIVGYATNSSTLNAQAVTWEDDLISGLTGEMPAEAASINEAGQIAGFTGRSGVDGIYACYWDNGVKYDLSTMFSSTSRATGINNHGQVIGFSYGNQNGFLWDPTSGLTYLGTYKQANGINDFGQVVLSGQGTVYLYEDGVMSNLNFTAYPKSINNHGQIVGMLEDGYNGTAFLWDNDTVYNLSDLLIPGQGQWDFSYSQAYDINENGQIVGFAMTGGKVHAFLMTPVPEPATVMLLGLGAVALRRRRQ